MDEEDRLHSYLLNLIFDDDIKDVTVVADKILSHTGLIDDVRVEEYSFRDGAFHFNGSAGAALGDSNFCIRIGHVADPRHYVLLACTEDQVTELKRPDADQQYFSGTVSASNATVEPHVEYILKVIDYGMYPWGRFQADMKNNGVRDVELNTICERLGVLRGAGQRVPVNCCSYVHLMAGLLDVGACDLESFLSWLDPNPPAPPDDSKTQVPSDFKAKALVALKVKCEVFMHARSAHARARV